MDRKFFQDKIRKSIDELDQSLKELQERYIRSAMFLGYTREAIRESGDNLQNFIVSTPNDEDIPDIIDPSVKFFESLNTEVNASFVNTSLNEARIRAITSSAASAVNSTGAISESTGYNFPIIFNGTAFTIEDRREEYSQRLSHLSPDLGQTYKGIDEALYATVSDSERSALFLARQSFDELLDTLAPIVDVRNSSYWRPKSPKEDKNDNAVWRIERIKYAAGMHIKNKARANTLIAQADHILSVYNTLNKAHIRGAIDQNVALKAIRSMKLFLEEWVDALEA